MKPKERRQAELFCDLMATSSTVPFEVPLDQKEELKSVVAELLRRFALDDAAIREAGRDK